MRVACGGGGVTLWGVFVGGVGGFRASEEEGIVVRRSLVRPMTRSMVEGRVVVLGDAAHPLASTGEGANLALEDAAQVSIVSYILV